MPPLSFGGALLPVVPVFVSHFTNSLLELKIAWPSPSLVLARRTKLRRLTVRLALEANLSCPWNETEALRLSPWSDPTIVDRIEEPKSTDHRSLTIAISSAAGRCCRKSSGRLQLPL